MAIKKYKHKYITLRKQAENEYESRRIIRMLRNLPTEKFIFERPPIPHFQVFVSNFNRRIIGAVDMLGIVRHALIKRLYRE